MEAFLVHAMRYGYRLAIPGLNRFGTPSKCFLLRYESLR